MPYTLSNNEHPCDVTYILIQALALLIPQSHQTSSVYVLTIFCSEQDGHPKVLGRFKVLDVLAHLGSVYYIQVVCT